MSNIGFLSNNENGEWRSGTVFLFFFLYSLISILYFDGVDASTRLALDIAGGIGIPVAPGRIAGGWEGSDALEARVRHPVSSGIDILILAGRYRFSLQQGGNYGSLNITNLKNILRTKGGTLEVQSFGGGLLVVPRRERQIDYYLLLSMSWDRVIQHSVTFFTPEFRQTVKPLPPVSHLGIAFGAGLVVRQWRTISPFVEVADHVVNIASPGDDEGALQFPTVKIGMMTRLK